MINGNSPYPEWKFIMIILFAIVGGVGVVVGLFLGVKLLRRKYGGIVDQSETRESMLTASDRRSFEPLVLGEDIKETR